MKKVLYILFLLFLIIFIGSCDITGGSDDAGEVWIEILPSVGGFVWETFVEINVTAEDQEKVEKVKIYVDDVLKIEDFIEPFTYNWNTSGYEYGDHEIKAKAYYGDGSKTTETETVYLSPCAVTTEDLEEFTGITETDFQGNLTGNIDDDDWNFGIGSQPEVQFGPAYPNPCNEACFIRIELDQDRTLSMIILNQDNEIIEVLIDNVLYQAGEHFITWNAPDNVNDIYRCILHVTNGLHWHGDILVE